MFSLMANHVTRRDATSDLTDNGPLKALLSSSPVNALSGVIRVHLCEDFQTLNTQLDKMQPHAPTRKEPVNACVHAYTCLSLVYACTPTTNTEHQLLFSETVVDLKMELCMRLKSRREDECPVTHQELLLSFCCTFSSNYVII